MARSKLVLGMEEKWALISVCLDEGVGSGWDSAAQLGCTGDMRYAVFPPNAAIHHTLV